MYESSLLAQLNLKKLLNENTLNHACKFHSTVLTQWQTLKMQCSLIYRFKSRQKQSISIIHFALGGGGDLNCRKEDCRILKKALCTGLQNKTATCTICTQKHSEVLQEPRELSNTQGTAGSGQTQSSRIRTNTE